MLDHNFTGRKIIIYNIEGESPIASTSVLSFDKNSKIVTVRSSAFEGALPERVVLLILGEGSVFEFRGTVRKPGNSGVVNIAIYQGKNKEDRKARRYELNLPASVENLVVAGKLIPLREPIMVTVLNISTGGILMKGKGSLFNIGTTVLVNLQYKDTVMRLQAKIIRIISLEGNEFEYGCLLKAQN